MLRILEVFGEPLSNGGQEAFIMNMYESINKDKVQFDFFTPYYCDNDFMKNRIKELGGKLFVSNKEFETPKRKKIFVDELERFLLKHKYNIIHIHSGSTFVLANGAKIAKKHGVKSVIVHSHVNGTSKLKSMVLKTLFGHKLLKNVDVYFACSKLAATYRFPNKIISEEKYLVIKNGINTSLFSFNDKVRKAYREELGLENCFVTGNVGRMELQKNHEFTIDVFYELSKMDSSSRLLLIGTGSLETQIRSQIKKLNLDDKVLILSKRNDVNKILQAMDVFLFPSLFEGLGIVAIEAQNAGLPTICSENIPDEANLTDLFKVLKLDEDKKKWAKELLKYKECKRKNYTQAIKNAGYDASQSAEILEKIYLKENGDSNE